MLVLSEFQTELKDISKESQDMIKMILNSLAKEIMEALDVRKEGSVDVRTNN